MGVYYNNDATVARFDNGTTGRETVTFAAPNDCYINFWSGTIWTANTKVIDNIQLEYGSVATDYEPYQSDTYEIDLSGTRYGGTLDVGTGVLTVTHGIVDLGTLTWNLNNGYGMYSYGISSLVIKPDYRITPDIYCSSYKKGSWNTLYNSGKTSGVIAISDSGVVGISTTETDTNAFKTQMSGVQFVYPLADPVTVQLTPQEVTTLLGTNNIFADCGDVSCKYRADTRLYIDKVLNA